MEVCAVLVKGLGRISWDITNSLILEICAVLDGVRLICLILNVKQPAVNGCHGGAEAVCSSTVVPLKLSNNFDDAVVRGSRLYNLDARDLVCSAEYVESKSKDWVCALRLLTSS